MKKESILEQIELLYAEAEGKAKAWQEATKKAEAETGRIMQNVRLKHKLSLRQLAKRLSVSATHLSDMENGQRRYSIAWAREALTSMGEK